MRVLAGRYCSWLVPSGVRDPRRGASHKRGVLQVRPYRWDGGALSYAAASAPSAPNCSPVLAVPATLTKDTANAITFSNGLQISGVIGIDLSLKTRFNTSTKIKHVFSSVGQLCGSDSTWPSASRVVGK